MTLKQIVDDYINKHRKKAEKEMRWFKIQKTLTDAISLAAMAITPSWKRFGHQRGIPKRVLKQTKHILLSNIEIIQNVTDFDDLHHRIYKLLGNLRGIGNLYIYDTSLRIGAKLGFEPIKVYLHAGTLEGAKRLGLNTKKGYLSLKSLPSDLGKFKPREIEDCLCIYKNEF
jgi:hypothetical protein